MSYTDYAIIYFLLFICVITGEDTKQQLLSSVSQQYIMYNNILDTAVSDSLRDAYDLCDNIPVLNKNKVRIQLDEGMRHILGSTSNAMIIVAMTDADGVTIYNYGKEIRIEYRYYPFEEHVDVIRNNIEQIINSSIEKSEGIDYKFQVSYTERFNQWYNTIGDCGIITIYEVPYKSFDGFQGYIVSGACVE